MPTTTFRSCFAASSVFSHSLCQALCARAYPGAKTQATNIEKIRQSCFILVVTTKHPVRLSRNRNSEYLPQRRKGRKVRRLRVKIIYKSFCPFPITLAPLRLGGRNSRLRVLSMVRLFAQAAQ